MEYQEVFLKTALHCTWEINTKKLILFSRLSFPLTHPEKLNPLG